MLPDKVLDERLARIGDYDDLARFVWFELKLKLGDIVSNRANLPQMRFALIERVNNLGIRGQFEAAVLAGTGGSLPDRDQVVAYLDRMIELAEIEAAPYSTLRGVAATAPSNREMTLVQRHFAGRLPSPIRHESRKQERSETYDDVLAAFPKISPVMLLGDPGAGKSTSMWKIFLNYAEPSRRNERAPVPVFFRLGRWTGDEALAEFIDQEAQGVGWAIEGLSKAGRLVLLLDGLNEVPTAKREKKAEEVAEFVKGLPGKPAVMISCRREDHKDSLDLQFDTLTLEPLSAQQIRLAVCQWAPDRGEKFFWELAGDERLSQVYEKWLNCGLDEDEFWKPTSIDWKAAILIGWDEYGLLRGMTEDRSNLLRLAANPFTLMMLFEVWQNKQEIPRNRGQLFETFVSWLLDRERLKGQARANLLDGLAALAWRMQRDRVKTGEVQTLDFSVLTVLSKDEALREIGGEEVLKQATDCTIVETSPEVRFRHQLLQEYFTARALQSRMSKIEATELWPPDRWWERSGWEETVVLLTGIHAEDCSTVIRWLADAQPEVAARCLQESGAGKGHEQKLLKELQSAWEPRMVGPQSDRQPEGRAAIGRALGRLEIDSRRGIGVRDGVPEIDWVEIPGGEFIYQEGERRKIERFYIARYPITNAQYQAFLDAKDGYKWDRWWKGLTKPERTPGEARWKESNHPRETVSWYEAMAFCAWLDSRIGGGVRLPTEWEWERAARGTGGQAFPWGDEYRAGLANINETWEHDRVGPHNLGRTSPVGIYPQGASPEGVLDLSGNVWEWCLNEFKKPERIQRGGTEARVVRGGSWSYDLDYARAPVRDATASFRSTVTTISVFGWCARPHRWTLNRWSLITDLSEL